MACTIVQTDPSYVYNTSDLVTILSLTAGQQVWISPNGISQMAGTSGDLMYSWFSGHLVRAL